MYNNRVYKSKKLSLNHKEESKMNNLKITNDNGKTKIMLDNFEVKCVRNYEIKSSSTTGIAELTLKIFVKTTGIEP